MLDEVFDRLRSNDWKHGVLIEVFWDGLVVNVTSLQRGIVEVLWPFVVGIGMCVEVVPALVPMAA